MEDVIHLSSATRLVHEVFTIGLGDS